MSQEKFKIVGKPVHKNKHQAIFELFDEYLEKTNLSSLDLIFVSENLKNPSSMTHL